MKRLPPALALLLLAPVLGELVSGHQTLFEFANPLWLPPWPVTFVFLAGLDVATLWLVLRWSGNGTSWDDRHRLALVIGMLAFFLAFGILQDIVEGSGGMSIVTIVAAWTLRKLWVQTQERYTNADTIS